MKVDVMKLSQGSKNLSLRSGATAGDAVDQSGFSTQGCNLVRNGVRISRSTSLSDGDTVNIVANVKGGSGTVTVTRLGSREQSHTLRSGDTLSSLLRRANVSTSGCTVYLQGVEESLNTTLRDGDKVIVAPRVEGGN